MLNFGRQRATIDRQTLRCSRLLVTMTSRLEFLYRDSYYFCARPDRIIRLFAVN
jgi:hypothetical protein